MLKSGARSPLVRFVGHAFAVLCAALFGYTIVVALVAGLTAGSVVVAAWVLGAASISVTFVVIATTYVARRPYKGGYFLVALACLAATFLCLVSFIPLFAF